MDFMLKIISFTPDTLAELWKTDEKYVVELLASKEIPAYKIMGKWFIRGSDLADWIEEQIQKSSSQQLTEDMKSRLEELNNILY